MKLLPSRFLIETNLGWRVLANFNLGASTLGVSVVEAGTLWLIRAVGWIIGLLDETCWHVVPLLGKGYVHAERLYVPCSSRVVHENDTLFESVRHRRT